MPSPAAFAARIRNAPGDPTTAVLDDAQDQSLDGLDGDQSPDATVGEENPDVPAPTLPEDRTVEVWAALNYHATDTRTAWALDSHTGYVVTGELDRVDPGAALLAGLEHLLTAPEYTDRPVVLLCPHPGFLAQIRPLAEAWPHLTIEPPASLSANGWLAQRAAQRAAHLLCPPAPAPEPLPAPEPAPLDRHALCQRTRDGRIVAAADGSAGYHGGGRRLAGYGWVINPDWYGHGTVNTNNIDLAELHAIYALLHAIPAEVRLHVLVDSRSALGIVRQIRAEAPTPFKRMPGKTRALAEKIQSLLDGRDVTFEWVPSHAGVLLNEIADRLAVQARRHEQGMNAKATFTALVEGILADLHTGLTTHRGDTGPDTGPDAGPAAAPEHRVAS